MLTSLLSLCSGRVCPTLCQSIARVRPITPSSISFRCLSFTEGDTYQSFHTSSVIVRSDAPSLPRVLTSTVISFNYQTYSRCLCNIELMSILTFPSVFVSRPYSSIRALSFSFRPREIHPTRSLRGRYVTSSAVGTHSIEPWAATTLLISSIPVLPICMASDCTRQSTHKGHQDTSC